jgi:hypothetical protein
MLQGHAGAWTLRQKLTAINARESPRLYPPPVAWPEALKVLTDALGVAGAAYIVSSKTASRVDWVCFSGLSAEFQLEYINHYAPLDHFSPLLEVAPGWTKLSECLPDSLLRKKK